MLSSLTCHSRFLPSRGSGIRSPDIIASYKVFLLTPAEWSFWVTDQSDIVLISIFVPFLIGKTNINTDTKKDNTKLDIFLLQFLFLLRVLQRVLLRLFALKD